MTTWAELKSDIRLRLKDTNANRYRWSDAELLMYCRDAIRDFSTRFPRKREQLVTVESGTASYSLDDDVVAVTLVTLTTTSGGSETVRTLRELRPVPGVVLDADRLGYIVYGQTLRLHPTPTTSASLVLNVNCLWPTPSADEDTLQTPTVADLALKYLIVALALERDEIADSLLRRWADASDGLRRDDNPLRPTARQYRQRYLEEIAWLRDSGHYLLG